MVVPAACRVIMNRGGSTGAYNNGGQLFMSTSSCRTGMDFICFSSDDPAAVNASLLYDRHNDDVNLWERGILNSPLPTCSPPTPTDPPCLMCLKNKVFAVCHNLKDGLEMVMEGSGESIDIKKSECPTFSQDDPQWLLPVIISVIILAIIFIVIIGGLCFRRRPNEQTGENDLAGEGDALTDLAQTEMRQLGSSCAFT